MAAPSLDLPIPPQEWAQLIIEWYRRNRRDLPWRRDSDPYRVWLSEIMLQQTQVRTVIPYYQRFLEAYPELEDLAGADESDVMDLWAGLGYYRRARNLLRCAIEVREHYAGSFPQDFGRLVGLPGIGRYSAGAILSIAFGLPFPVVDGNVQRVLTRYLALEATGSASPFWHLLEKVVALPDVARAVSDFNQGLMELGAEVCTPRRPECPKCPLSKTCRALGLGIQLELPRSRRPRSREIHRYCVAVACRGERFLMRRSVEDAFLRGFWEFPKVRMDGADEQPPEVLLQQGLSVALQVREPLGEVCHQVTFRSLRFLPFLIDVAGESLPTDWRWLRIGENGFPMSAYIKKIAQLVMSAGTGTS